MIRKLSGGLRTRAGVPAPVSGGAAGGAGGQVEQDDLQSEK